MSNGQKFSFVIRSSEQKKKEKRRKLGIIALAIVAVMAVLYYMGSPVVWLTVQPKAWHHVRQEHPEVTEKVRSGQNEFFKGIWKSGFYSANNSGVSFEIIYDKHGEMLSCGYESWYLKGGNQYYSLSLKYEDAIHELTEGKIDEDGYLFFHGEMTDFFIWLTVNYSPTGSYSKAMAIDYKGPYLNPEKNYTQEDFARITKEHGTISCYANIYDGEKQDFVNRTMYAIDKLKKADLCCRSFTSTAYTGKEDGNPYYFKLSRELTYDEIFSENLQKIIEDNTVLVTYGPDGEVLQQ